MCVSRETQACMAMTRQLLNQVTEQKRIGNVWNVGLTWWDGYQVALHP